VPTLYIWANADAPSGRTPRTGTREFIGAAYAMEVLPGVGHFVMDQAATKATELSCAHEEAPGVGGGERELPPCWNRATTRRLHEREFYAWLARRSR